MIQSTEVRRRSSNRISHTRIYAISSQALAWIAILLVELNKEQLLEKNISEKSYRELLCE